MRSIVFFLLLASIHTQAQEYKLLMDQPAKADKIATDNLGNYYLQHGHEVVKYNAQGEQMGRYSSKLLGSIDHIDATNPMKLTLWYRDQTQVVFLDDFLAEQGNSISLEKSDLEQTTTVCSSVNNGLWAYDFRDFQIVRVDENMNRVSESGNLVQLLGLEIEPNFLLERNNWVYLNDPNHGIFVFDIFGTYLKTIPIKGLEQFQVYENSLIYFEREGKFFSYHLKLLNEQEVELPSNESKQVRVEKNRLFILTEDHLKVFSRS